MPHEAGHKEEDYTYPHTGLGSNPFGKREGYKEERAKAVREAAPGEIPQTFPDPTYEIPLADLETLQAEMPAYYKRIKQYLDKGTDRGKQQAYSLWAEWSTTTARDTRRRGKFEKAQAVAAMDAEDAGVIPSTTIESTLNRASLGWMQEDYQANFAQLYRYYQSAEGGNLSAERARIEATRRLMYWMVVPRTASGRPMELSADVKPEDYGSVSTGKALLSALLPQTLTTEEEQRRYNMMLAIGEETSQHFRAIADRYARQGFSPKGAVLTVFGKPEGMSQEDYAATLSKERRAAGSEVRMSGGRAGRARPTETISTGREGGTKQRNQAIYEALANAYLPFAYEQFLTEARDVVKSGAGQIGEELTESQVDRQARLLASLQYKTFQETTFAFIDEPATAPGATTAQTSHDMFGAATAAGVDMAVRSVFYHERDVYRGEHYPQGEIVETFAMAGMRGMAGAVRVAIDPMVEALSYEVTAQGTPVDSTDLNYRMAQATDKAYRDWTAGDRSLSSYGMLVGGQISGALAQFELDYSRTRFEGTRISTGNWLKDSAASIATGQWLADDFEAIVGTGAVYAQMGMPDAPYYLGASLEMLVPLNPGRVAAPFVRTGARFTSKTIRGSANTLGSSAALIVRNGAPREFMSAMGVTLARPTDFIANPVASAQRSILFRELRAGLAGADANPAFSESGRLFRESSLPGVIATRLSNEILDKALPMLMSNNKLAGALKYGSNTALGRIVHQLEDAWGVYRSGHSSLEGVNNSVLGQKVLDSHYAATITMHAPGSQEFHRAVMHGVLEDLLRQHFAHMIPNKWVVVSDFVLVPKEVFNSRAYKQVQKANKFLFEESSTGVFKNTKEVIDTLTGALGRQKINQSPFWSEVSAKIVNQTPLSTREWNSVTGMMTAGVVKREVTGSIKIDFAGPAYKKALEAGARRPKDYAKEPLRESLKTIVDGAKSTLGFDKGGKLAAEEWAPISVSKMMADVNAELSQLDHSFIELLRQVQREGGKPLDDLMIRFSSDDVVEDLIDILKVFFKESELNKQFLGTDLKAVLEQAGFAGKKLTPELVQDAIATTRAYATVLMDKGLKTRTVTGGVRRPKVGAAMDAARAQKTDAPDIALYAWLMDKHKGTVITKHMQKFTSENPELLVRLGGDDISDAQTFRAIARQQNVPDEIIQDIIPIIFGRSGTGSAMDASHFHELLEQVVSDLFFRGQISGGNVNRQFGYSLRGRGTASDIARTGPVRNVVEAAVRKRLPNATDEAVRMTTNKIVDDILGQMMVAATDVNMANLVGKLRSLGLRVPVDHLPSGGRHMTSVKAEVLKLEDNMAVILPSKLYTAEEKAMFQKLVSESASGKLWAKLDDLPDADRADFLGMLGRYLDMTNRTAVSGVLGGFPGVNGKYLGLNLITAPLIAIITQPTYVGTVLMAMVRGTNRGAKGTLVGALGGGGLGEATRKALNEAMSQAPTRSTPYRWFASKFGTKPDSVVMTDKWGRKWTKARLENSINSHNFRISQSTFEFRDMTLDQIRRVVARNPNLSRAGWLKQTWRYLDPRNKNLWGMVAENTDNVFREACYVEGIRRGLTENQSMMVARNVLLDYGAIPKLEKERIARSMLFYAFSRQMAGEVIKTLLYRDARAVSSQIKFAYHQHEEAGTWMFENDYMRSYLWSELGKEIDGMPVQESYIRAPALETFLMLNNAMWFGIDALDMMISKVYTDPDPRPWTRGMAEYPLPGITEGSRRQMHWSAYDVTKGVADSIPWRPELQTGLDLLIDTWGARPTAQSQMPTWGVLAFESLGMMDFATSFFGLERVHGTVGKGEDPGDLRAGYPLVNVQLAGETHPSIGQYRFGQGEGQAGFALWKAFEYVTLVTGIQRNIRDYTMAGVKLGHFPEGSAMKYTAEGNWALYFGGVQTTNVFTPEVQIMEKIHKRIAREAKESLPEDALQRQRSTSAEIHRENQ